MPEFKNSLELRKLPRQKRRTTETRRTNKKTKHDNLISLETIYDNTYYNIEHDNSTLPHSHSFGSKYFISTNSFFMFIFIVPLSGADHFLPSNSSTTTVQSTYPDTCSGVPPSPNQWQENMSADTYMRQFQEAYTASYSGTDTKYYCGDTPSKYHNQPYNSLGIPSLHTQPTSAAPYPNTDYTDYLQPCEIFQLDQPFPPTTVEYNYTSPQYSPSDTQFNYTPPPLYQDTSPSTYKIPGLVTISSDYNNPSHHITTSHQKTTSHHNNVSDHSQIKAAEYAQSGQYSQRNPLHPLYQEYVAQQTKSPALL